MSWAKFVYPADVRKLPCRGSEPMSVIFSPVAFPRGGLEGVRAASLPKPGGRKHPSCTVVAVAKYRRTRRVGPVDNRPSTD